MKMILAPDIIIPSSQGSPANSSSMGANIISAPIICQQLALVSFGFSWTGTNPIGLVSVQGSNDYKFSPGSGLVISAGTWNDLTFNYLGSAVSSIPLSGNIGNGLIDLTMTGIYALRVVYTSTSGTGALTVTACGKG